MKRCTRCDKMSMRDDLYTNALSRRDNETYICSKCGAEEAMIDAGLDNSSEALVRDGNFAATIRRADR